MMNKYLLAGMLLAVNLCACANGARLPVEAGTGPQPTLPPPTKSLIPTVNVAPAVGWPAGTKPIAAEGFTVSAFAGKLDSQTISTRVT
ncbi:MAG: L-sorbosone dehydrogenase [Paucimonas sp.]|jgi:hypothetical protein|nr:L-sorbosone dehydrogenase [Paucimonas sp.]